MRRANEDKYAVIDIGSNTCRLWVADYCEGTFTPLINLLETTRLGEGMGASEVLLAEEAIKRTEAALFRFHHEIRLYTGIKVRAVATSALREAVNQQEVAQRFEQALQYPVEIISGQQEAYYSYLGVAKSLPIAGMVVVDIGGGSTEFTWQSNGVIESCSLPLGAVRCTRRGDNVHQIAAVLLAKLGWQVASWPASPSLVGVGGTVTTMAAVSLRLACYDAGLVHGYSLTNNELGYWLLRLQDLPLGERRLIPGLEYDRAEIIIAGLRILWTILTLWQMPAITVADTGLVQGLAWSMATNGRSCSTP